MEVKLDTSAAREVMAPALAVEAGAVESPERWSSGLDHPRRRQTRDQATVDFVCDMWTFQVDRHPACTHGMGWGEPSDWCAKWIRGRISWRLLGQAPLLALDKN